MVGTITYADFGSVDIRVGTVVAPDSTVPNGGKLF